MKILSHLTLIATILWVTFGLYSLPVGVVIGVAFALVMAAGMLWQRGED